MSAAQRDSVTLADGRRLAIEIEGASHGGVPIFLIRPLGGSIALWGAFREALAERARVIAFDRSGAGDSSDAPAVFGTRDMAADAVAVLDRLGVGAAHVFGISLGGMVATWLAIDAPDRVARLCLASTPDAGLDVSRSGLFRGASLSACLARPSDEVEACLVRRILSRPFREGDPARLEKILALVKGHPARRLEIVKQASAALLHDPRGELHRIKAPTLVLAGEHDELLGRAPQAQLAASIPDARIELFEGAGHDIALEEPLGVAGRVARFFLDEAPAH